MAEAVRNSGSVAAIATLITLIYLAVQIRESSQVSRLSLQENFVSGQEEFFHYLLANEETYRVWRLGSTTTDELSEEDRERFGLILYGQMYRYHVMYQARTLEPLEYDRSLIQIDRPVSSRASPSIPSSSRSSTIELGRTRRDAIHRPEGREEKAKRRATARINRERISWATGRRSIPN